MHHSNRSEEDVEDSRALLPESEWTKSDDANPAFDRRPYHRAWEVWVIGFICLISGMGIGALLSRTGAVKGGGMGCMDGSGRGKVEGVESAPFGFNVSVTFAPNTDFQKDGGPEADAIWDSLQPRGKGFIQLDSAGNAVPYDMQDETNTKIENMKVVSVFHQLHCLNHIRKSLLASTAPDPSTLSDPTHSSFSSNSDSASNPPSKFQYIAPHLKTHWHHCFDYLRQSLMCHADTTLETLERSKVDGRLLRSVDGWGTKHQCRDFGGLWGWAQEARAVG